jgi:hypothetical protein
VTNPGTESVAVASWQTSCDCQKINPASATIAPGETLPVHMTIDLTRGSPDIRSDLPRRVAVRLRPQFADSAESDRSGWWQVSGTVKPFYRVVSATQNLFLKCY